VCVCVRVRINAGKYVGQVVYTDGKGYILMGSEACGHRSVEVLFCHFPLKTTEDLEKILAWHLIWYLQCVSATDCGITDIALH